MISALPPPEIVATLVAPGSRCVISLQRSDAESGDVTTSRCGRRIHFLAHSHHGDSVRRIGRCAAMLMIEGVELPELLQVNNCHGTLRVRRTGEIWTRQLLAAARVAPSRLDRVIYYPVPGRPACYKVLIAFTPSGRPTNTSLLERSALRCDRAA